MNLLATSAYLCRTCRVRVWLEYAFELPSFPCLCTREEKVLDQLFFTHEDCLAKACESS